MTVRVAEKRKLGIGQKGATLKEMLAHSRKLWEKTGHYYGLKELPLTAKDPLKTELLWSRLLAAVVAGRESARMVAASPLIREVGELATAIYTPEGHCIIQSTGIVIHITLMGEVIQWMIDQDYEHDVQIGGIKEGDIFTSSDPNIAGMHSMDVYDITPIFWEGELVAWVSTVVMEGETGAIAPGAQSSGATERFVDGLKFICEKTGTNDTYFKSFDRRVRWGVRTPDIYLIDRKGALAADIRTRENIKSIIAEVGIDYFREGVRELIEVERRAQLQRVKNRTVPGRYHSVTTYEHDLTKTIAPPHHAIQKIVMVPTDFWIKPDGKYRVDLDGAGEWLWAPTNCVPSSIEGGICMGLSQTIAYTGHTNQGTFLGIELNAPYDTFVNPSSPHISTCNFFTWPVGGAGRMLASQSRAFFSRGFIEEVLNPNNMHTCFAVAGTDHYGHQSYGLVIVELTGAHGSGAFAYRDGIISEVIWLPNSDMGNIEIWELVTPVAWMGRKLQPNSEGPGKFRSGPSLLSTQIIYRTKSLSMDISSILGSRLIYPNSGLFGGYPGPGPFNRVITKANTKDLIANRKPLAHGELMPGGVDDLAENIKGDMLTEVDRGVYIPRILKHGDWIQAFYGSQAGGFGDPIERDPSLAKSDLDNNLVTAERCRNVYCIEARYDKGREEWVIDDAKTEETRDKRRKERLAKGVPAEQWWRKRRQDLLAGKLPPLMKDMYNGSLTKGSRWPGEFRAFWALPADFKFEVEED